MSVVQNSRILTTAADAGVGGVAHAAPRVAIVLEEAFHLIFLHSHFYGLHYLAVSLAGDPIGVTQNLQLHV
ncbi:hypothetical protein NL476_28365, partial [Klebsiella pneumoniae]|nr:hypothetical protein [Klebsiella pneumoniae]